MKPKYGNFQVKDELLQPDTKQEPVKTNHSALDAIRKQQSQARVERPVANVRTIVAGIDMTFNEWAGYVNNLLKK